MSFAPDYFAVVDSLARIRRVLIERGVITSDEGDSIIETIAPDLMQIAAYVLSETLQAD